VSCTAGGNDDNLSGEMSAADILDTSSLGMLT
jgi:hypothetical protein